MASTPSRKPYEGSARDRWCADHTGSSDKPHVEVWMPQAPPMASLRVRDNGCHAPLTLPPGPPLVDVTIGGVRIGGYLDEIELLFQAALECIQWERDLAEELRASDRSGEAGQ